MKTKSTVSKFRSLASAKLIVSGLVLITFIACNSIANSKTETFKVWGNCGMCKKTIENALDAEGIKGDWNKKTKMIVVSYDSLIHNSQQVHAFICSAGYDTETCKADDKVYAKLHECCQYERK